MKQRFRTGSCGERGRRPEWKPNCVQCSGPDQPSLVMAGRESSGQQVAPSCEPACSAPRQSICLLSPQKPYRRTRIVTSALTVVMHFLRLCDPRELVRILRLRIKAEQVERRVLSVVCCLSFCVLSCFNS